MNTILSDNKGAPIASPGVARTGRIVLVDPEGKLVAMDPLSAGLRGKTIITDGAAHTPTSPKVAWWMLHAVTDCVIGSITDAGADGGSLAGVTISAGDQICGYMTSITLTSGTAEAYYL